MGTILTALQIIGIFAMGVCITALFFALKHHYGWFNDNEKEEYKHWKERHYSSKKTKS